MREFFLLIVLLRFIPLALDTENRGLGCGFLMSYGRVSSPVTPVIATFANVTTPFLLHILCLVYRNFGDCIIVTI